MSGSPGLPTRSSASSPATEPPQPAIRGPGTGEPPDQPHADPQPPPALGSATPHEKRSDRWIYVLGVLGFLAYASWMMGPYLHSVIVRDAAVTTWSNVATAPIDGVVEFKPLPVDRVVGPDGIIVLVRNDRLSRLVVTEAEIRVDLARTRVAELQNFLDDVMLLDEGRADLKALYADTFRAQLDAEIASLERQIGVTSDQLGVMREVASRSIELARRGTGSKTTADEERLRLSGLALGLAELEAALAYAEVRRQAADNHVFITVDGEDPAWVRGSRMDLKLAKKQARLELRQAQAELDLATAALEAATADFERLSEGAVRAPPGSIVWSERVAPGATVTAGTPVAEWLDCTALMVDVPVSDAEVALIRPGMAAEAVLEGESVTREASVLLTRGSASTLGRDDLAALAKTRGEGVAQVLLKLLNEPQDLQDCPVGRAAYVDFPDIGLIDVIRVRLRL